MLCMYRIYVCKYVHLLYFKCTYIRICGNFERSTTLKTATLRLNDLLSGEVDGVFDDAVLPRPLQR